MNLERFVLKNMWGLPRLEQPMAQMALLACVVSTIVLALIWFNRRHWFFQPSLLIMSAIHLRIQWPSLFILSWATDNLPRPLDFVLLTQLFPILYLAAAIPISISRDATLREFADRLRTQMRTGFAWPRTLTWVCFWVSLSVFVVILLLVPFGQSAFYVFFTDPGHLHIARARIWNTLPSRYASYVLLWNYCVFAPLLIFASVLILADREQRLLHGPMALLFFCTGFFGLTFAGSRGGITIIGLLIVAAYYCAKLRKPSWKALTIGAIFVLSLPAYVSLMREGHDWTWSKQWEYIYKIAEHRILGVPVQVGNFYIHHAQTMGFTGVKGVRPLAYLMGEQYEPSAVGIADTYFKGGYSNSNAIFEYYKMAGLWSIPITVCGLLFLDFFLQFLRPRSIALLPFVIFFTIRGIQGSETSLTILFLTGGFLFVPLLAWFSRLPMVGNLDESLRNRSQAAVKSEISNRGQ